jgi:hypothetical protein
MWDDLSWDGGRGKEGFWEDWLAGMRIPMPNVIFASKQVVNAGVICYLWHMRP